jgi:3-oxoacyl-[acyl-carrier-protein] synthase III
MKNKRISDYIIEHKNNKNLKHERLQGYYKVDDLGVLKIDENGYKTLYLGHGRETIDNKNIGTLTENGESFMIYRRKGGFDRYKLFKMNEYEVEKWLINDLEETIEYISKLTSDEIDYVVLKYKDIY